MESLCWGAFARPGLSTPPPDYLCGRDSGDRLHLPPRLAPTTVSSIQEILRATPRFGPLRNEVAYGTSVVLVVVSTMMCPTSQQKASRGAVARVWGIRRPTN